MSIIILVISILLDGILNNILPYINLSLFTPLLTLIAIIVIYPFYKKNDEKYLLTIFITGIIYDLLYTNLLFYNSIFFLTIGLLNIYIYKKTPINYLTINILLLLDILIYILLNSFILFICNIVTINITKMIYIFTHSIILNIIYGFILFVIIKGITNKNKKIKLN